MSTGLPDIIGPDLLVIFCGINPASTAAASGHHFSSHSNRFWRVMHLAGFTPEQILADHDRSILKYGCGLTTVVARATRRAAEVDTAEFRRAAPLLERKIRLYAPRAVAFLGKPAYAAIVGKSDIQWGRQTTPFGGADAWVVPNPSGLNRGFTLDGLVAAYRELRLSVSRK
jgi:double-stranded uracil-DNA glycosylase